MLTFDLSTSLKFHLCIDKCLCYIDCKCYFSSSTSLRRLSSFFFRLDDYGTTVDLWLLCLVLTRSVSVHTGVGGSQVVFSIACGDSLGEGVRFPLGFRLSSFQRPSMNPVPRFTKCSLKRHHQLNCQPTLWWIIVSRLVSFVLFVTTHSSTFELRWNPWHLCAVCID